MVVAANYVSKLNSNISSSFLRIDVGFKIDSKSKKIKIQLTNTIEFSKMIQEITSSEALSLFDEEGIKYISYDPNGIYKLQILLSSKREFLKELFKNFIFCRIISEKSFSLIDCFSNLDSESAISYIDYLRLNNQKLLKQIIKYFSSEVQEEIITTGVFPKEFTQFLIINASDAAVSSLYEKYLYLIDIDAYSFSDLYALFSKKCRIPGQILGNPDFKRKIVTIESIKDYRFLVNTLEYHNDTLEIESLRKRFYDREISSYDEEVQMLSRYYSCFLELCDLISKNIRDEVSFERVMRRYFNPFGSSANDNNTRINLLKHYKNGDIEELRLTFINESKLQLSNMIIDYHFEDIPYNFFLDIKQLCQFQDDSGRTLSDEDLKLYSSLIDIDSLSYTEKLRLHEYLKKENFRAKHYDIFREAKDRQSTLMNEQILNAETIEKYYSASLSKSYGIPIYLLDGDNFMCFIRSLTVRKYRTLEADDLLSISDGASYSLDSQDKLDTYRNPQIYYQLIFSEFPIDQVVHVASSDSFSNYQRNSYQSATSRVYELCTPRELIEKSNTYNEIVLAHPSYLNNDEVNSHLRQPTLLGLYCYDSITPGDVESAKKLGVGIVLVNTKAYMKKPKNKLSLLEMFELSKRRRYEKLSYFEDIECDDMAARRAKEKSLLKVK